MAMIRRTMAATLAALALAGTAAQPAQAYWHAKGTGTDTVRVASGDARAVTLTLSTQGNRYAVSGSVGRTSAFGNAPFTVNVVFCSISTTWPCPTTSIVTTLSVTTNTGSYTGMTPSGVSYHGIKAYGMASQTQTSGWTDYSPVAGPVTP
jgi:hypothetical protein